MGAMNINGKEGQLPNGKLNAANDAKKQISVAAEIAPREGRAEEVEELLLAVQDLIIPYIKLADGAQFCTPVITGARSGDDPAVWNKLVHPEALDPKVLSKVLALALPERGLGKNGLLEMVSKVLKYSVNTWNPGFMDKLYASTNAPGVAAELLLSILNTNVHVYQVSPALTVIEKATSKKLASLFGFGSAHAGGITCPGGSYSNSHSMVIARNSLYPDTKARGNGAYKFVVFTSSHGHYSVEKAAIMCGLGSDAVWQVPVDEKGSMVTSELENRILEAKAKGYTPLYVNAGAGTTVLGSYDPFTEIGHLCEKYGLWLHVDGSWGGSVVFSEKLKHKLDGVHLANSLTVNPHKMLGVPMTCSFLLTKDVRVFHKANTLKVGYLFHHQLEDEEVYDLADMTLGCGRRGDSLKLALGWIYYGKEGYESRINHAFEIAAYFTHTLSQRTDFHLLSSNPPPCLQICFFYTPEGTLSDDAMFNTKRTRKIAENLVHAGFMIDYAPDELRGHFFRAVVNSQVSREVVDSLIDAIVQNGTIV